MVCSFHQKFLNFKSLNPISLLGGALFLILSSPLSAQYDAVSSTYYQWLPQNVEGKKFSGKCYELDRETSGQKYQSIVPSSKCYPGKEEISHRWIQDQTAPKGKCFEVDRATGGNQYSKPVSWKFCTPKNKEYTLSEGSCYLLGQFETTPFVKKVNFDFCKSSQIEMKFVLGPSGIRGQCFEIDKVNNLSKPTSLSECRPDKTQFIWNSERGRCFEIPEDGNIENYIATASKNKCRPDASNLIYQWVQSEDPYCLEMSKDLSTNRFQNKVNDELCLKDIKMDYRFIKVSPIAGQCFQIDQETQGKKVTKKTGLDQCKDRVEELEIIPLTYNKKSYCIEIDKKNKESGYRRSISKKYCTIRTTEFKWIPNSENPFEGQCKKMSLYRGEEVWGNTTDKNCKTESTRYYWYTPDAFPTKWIAKQRKRSKSLINLDSIISNKDNLVFFGKCYEIDKEKGPLLYSSSVSSKKCKPSETTLRYFHPKKYLNGGCFVVDKKTRGSQFLKKTLDKACKDEFLKTKKEIEDENRDYINGI